MKNYTFKFLLLTLLIGTTIQANECEEGFYGKGFAGVNFLMNRSLFKPSHNIHAKFNPGFAGGAALGYKFPNFVLFNRIEGEFAYRHNKLKEIERIHTSGHVETYSFMCNLINEKTFLDCWKVYGGAGIGYNEIRAKIRAYDAKFASKDNGFAWQLLAGVGYQICEKTDLSLDYRYFSSKKLFSDQTVSLSLSRSF